MFYIISIIRLVGKIILEHFFQHFSSNISISF